MSGIFCGCRGYIFVPLPEIRDCRTSLATTQRSSPGDGHGDQQRKRGRNVGSCQQENEDPISMFAPSRARRRVDFRADFSSVTQKQNTQTPNPKGNI